MRNSKYLDKMMMTRRLLIEYVIIIILFFAAEILTAFLMRFILRLFVWSRENPLYLMLNWIEDNIVLWTITVFLAGWVVITFLFIRKLIGYLDEIAEAAGLMTLRPTEPIVLSPLLKGIQDGLNGVRETSVINARNAKDAERRKNDMIVYLAHDLKTPLTSVIGYLTMLNEEPEMPVELRARYSGIALNKAYRLEELINEFFDITRFSLSGLTLEPVNINMSRMMDQMASEFEPVLSQKNLTWHTEITPDCFAVCDSGKLERAFDNLIRNAVNYSYPGTEIYLGLRKASNGLVITLKNRGKTIAPEKLEKLFDQFFRVDSSRSSSTGGAGLGLAIVKEIITLHGGVVSVQSANEIIEFTVSIPYNCMKNLRNT